MLVLSRNAGEKISIGDTISVRVVAVSGNNVRFGIDAPEDVNVHRAEVYERIRAKKAKVKKT
ncbi:Carbon storage regulator [Pseudomonas fluorescens]|uniref:Translational regulator CsrA n=1 Tax=Pseudomonas fluorescens TaxID=294 RepID=A0A5E6QXR6_PSEFL|nr:carbon storage regulator CsrA [Pseudomonas fluorescens]VVM60327.1 Carbon storage regulator [Pseudomonas fluorescens]